MNKMGKQLDFYSPLKENDFNNSFGEKYWKVMNNNTRATVLKNRNLWNLAMALDELFVVELEDTSVIDDEKTTGRVLLALSHRFLRSSIVTVVSTRILEAYNISRMGIEAAVTASKILNNPSLFEIWAGKDQNKDSQKKYDNAFRYGALWNNHPASDIEIINNLKELWKGLSSFGTHPSISGSPFWLDVSKYETDGKFETVYLENDEELITRSLMQIIICYTFIELLFYNNFESRFKLDINLSEKRNRYRAKFENERKVVANKY